VVAYAIISIKIKNMSFHRPVSEPIITAPVRQRTADAVSALSTRLRNYSVVQTISLVGTTWYQMRFIPVFISSESSPPPELATLQPPF
jgi:hypothetical protein